MPPHIVYPTHATHIRIPLTAFLAFTLDRQLYIAWRYLSDWPRSRTVKCIIEYLCDYIGSVALFASL